MRVNEIFYTLQGEGAHTGTAAVFLRFAGCNLTCSFCDTQHETYTLMSEEEIVIAINKFPSTWVVITGGEPTIQLTESLIHKLHAIGKKVQIETNGTINPPSNADWITVSPKFEYCKRAEIKAERINELKVVYDGSNNMSVYETIKADHYFLQPCDLQNETKNKEIVNQVIEYIKNNPKWRLSLQTHKILNMP